MERKYRNSMIVLILLTSIILILRSYGVDGGNSEVSITEFEANEPFSFEEQVVNQSQFKLDGIGGDIIIIGIPGADSVTIAGIKRVQAGSTEDAEEHLQLLQVDVQAFANEMRVKTIKPADTAERIYNVDYTITLPDDLKIEIDNIGGFITLDSMANDVIVKNLAGNVTLVNILGSVWIDLLAGSIEGEVTLPLNGTINLKTLTGDINLEIPVNTSAEFSARIFLNRSISVSNLALQNEVITSTSWAGTLGSGNGMISLEAEVSGNINVSGLLEAEWVFQPGWNLFSSHLSNLDIDILNSVLTIANSPLWAWNGNRFVVHDTIAPGIGYWLHTQISRIIKPMGSLPNGTGPVLNDLVRGWNLFGIKGNTFIEASTIPDLNSNSPIWTWDNSLQKLISIQDQSLSPVEQGRLFPRRGYWIFNKQ